MKVTLTEQEAVEMCESYLRNSIAEGISPNGITILFEGQKEKLTLQDFAAQHKIPLIKLIRQVVEDVQLGCIKLIQENISVTPRMGLADAKRYIENYFNV